MGRLLTGVSGPLVIGALALSSFGFLIFRKIYF